MRKPPGPAGHGLEATPIVLGHDSPRAVPSRPPDLVVAIVMPGIPLIVPRRILSHPRTHGLERGVLQRGVEIRRLVRQRIQLRCAQLHVVRPVVLLVEVRRSGGRGLTYAGMRRAERVHSARAPSELAGVRAVAPLENTGAQRERRGVLSRRGREPGGAVLVLEQALRFPGAGVHRAPPAAPPSVIRGVVDRQVPEGVIAIVAQLVQEQVVFRVHL